MGLLQSSAPENALAPGRPADVGRSPTSRPAPRSFRPDIEGLRAVAVLVVVAHHAALGISGGYVGVDVFFLNAVRVGVKVSHRRLVAAGGDRRGENLDAGLLQRPGRTIRSRPWW